MARWGSSAGRRASAVGSGLTSGGAIPDARTRHVFRARTARLGPFLAGLSGVLLLLLVVAVLREELVVLAVAGVLLPAVVALMLRPLWVAFPRQRDLVGAQVLSILLLQDALVLAALLRGDRLSGPGEATLVAAVVLVQGVRSGFWLLQVVDGRQQARRVQARHLPEPLPPLPARPALLSGSPAPMALVSTLVPLGLAAALLSGRDAVVPAAAGLAVLAAAALVARVAPAVLRHRQVTRGGRRVRLVREAVERYAPLAVLYSTGGSEDLYWVTTWLDTLEHLGRRSVVLVRDPDVVDLLPETTVPVVCLPERQDIGRFVPSSARVSLFVAHGSENVRLLRSRTLRSAFIGHGDSDKAVSASPLSKSYDEVWVAGELGRQRYAEADVGVRPDAIRVVGRPQTRRVQAARAPALGELVTVLYAPSWEGVEGDPYESSLLHSGREVVQGLLASGRVRVVYRPHPKTGERNPAFLARHFELVRLLEQAGPPHLVDRPQTSDLLDRFNEAHVLVADRSGVLSDFLASDKPYCVINATSMSHEAFRAAHPSTAGAYLLGAGAAGLSAALDDALGPDTLRAQRRAARTAVIGPATGDALAPFVAAVDALAGVDDGSRPPGLSLSSPV